MDGKFETVDWLYSLNLSGALAIVTTTCLNRYAGLVKKCAWNLKKSSFVGAWTMLRSPCVIWSVYFIIRGCATKRLVAPRSKSTEVSVSGGTPSVVPQAWDVYRDVSYQLGLVYHRFCRKVNYLLQLMLGLLKIKCHDGMLVSWYNSFFTRTFYVYCDRLL